MRISLNSNNEIIGYAIVGDLEGSIEINNSILPSDFIPFFKPNKFRYIDGRVEYNNSFIDDSESTRLINENISLVEKVAKLESELEELKNNITPPE